MAKKKAPKKKTKKNAAKPKKNPASKRKAVKKVVAKKVVAKQAAAKKKKKKTAPKKAAVAKAKSVATKTQTVPVKKSAPPRQPRRQRIAEEPFSSKESRARSGGQSGDLQGLSDVGLADSESVDELLEEGNAFEADVVAGVQEAGDSEGREVHTHEVPEDDVPGEYLDED